MFDSNVSSKHPLVIIGLDGADWELINPWVREGKLPTFEKIIRGGMSCNMISTIPPITAPAMASFFTGLHPDKTGITGFLDAHGNIVNYRNIKKPAIWDFLGAVGIRSCVVGARLTYPAKNITGIMVSEGFLGFKSNRFVEPVDYLDRCEGFMVGSGEYPLLEAAMKKDRVGDPVALLKEAIILTEKQFSIFKDLRKREDCLFSLFWIEQTDFFQHLLFDRKDIILTLYQCIDRLIGDFIEDNKGLNLMLMSDHGFHSAPSEIFYVNSWLAKQGYLEEQRSFGRRVSNGVHYRLRRMLSETLPVHLRRRIRLALKRWFPKKGTRGADAAPLAGVSNAKDIAEGRQNFEVDSSLAYAIEPWGIRIKAQMAQESYEALREKILYDMRSLLDEKKNPVFSHVFKREELYSGEPLHEMPDILFLVQDRYDVNTYCAARVFAKYRSSRVAGSHNQAYNGIMIAFGESISKKEDLKEIKIVDFLPTVLDYFGIAIPDNIDGESKAYIFGLGIGEKRKEVMVSELDIDRDVDFTSDEEAKIIEKLRNLGYFE